MTRQLSAHLCHFKSPSSLAMVFFFFCGIPDELRGSVIDKVNLDAYCQLVRSSKLMYRNCLSTLKKRNATLSLVYIKDNAIVAYSTSKKSFNWFDIATCGFRFNIDRLRITTTSTEQIQKAIDQFRKIIHSVDTVTFPKNHAIIPQEIQKELITVTKPRVVNFCRQLSTCRLADIAPNNRTITYALDSGLGITDDDFLHLNHNLKIYSDCFISSDAIIEKLKRWKTGLGKDNYFHYSGKGTNHIPDDYAAQLIRIGAQEVDPQKPRDYRERPLQWKEMSTYKLTCETVPSQNIIVWLSFEPQQKRIFIEKTIQ